MAEKIDRLARVNELLKREIAAEISRGLITTSGLLVTITEVNSSVDLRNATVYVSIFGGVPATRRQVMDELERGRIDLQKHLAKTLGFKHTPVLDFRQDSRLEKGDRVLELIGEMERGAQDE